MESSAKPAIDARLREVLSEAEYEELVELVARAIFNRAMSERVTFSRPETAHRFRGLTWDGATDRRRDDWKDEARRALAGDETPYFPVE